MLTATFPPSPRPASGISSRRRSCPVPVRWRAPDAASCPARCGPALQMPAMFSSDPLGLASAVTSPLGSRVAEDNAVLIFQFGQRRLIAEVVAFHVADGNLQHLDPWSTAACRACWCFRRECVPACRRTSIRHCAAALRAAVRPRTESEIRCRCPAPVRHRRRTCAPTP